MALPAVVPLFGFVAPQPMLLPPGLVLSVSASSVVARVGVLSWRNVSCVLVPLLVGLLLFSWSPRRCSFSSDSSFAYCRCAAGEVERRAAVAVGGELEGGVPLFRVRSVMHL